MKKSDKRLLLLLVDQFDVLSDRFMVQSRDVIGWTNDEEYTLISYSITEHYLTPFFDYTELPKVNETITLDPVAYPEVFSVAVEIVQRLYSV